jgi:hypothetical protein
MMTGSSNGGLVDRDLARLRPEWVAAYRVWRQVAPEKALTSTSLTDEQRTALRRYRAAEAAYFNRLRLVSDSQPDNNR